MNEWFSGNEQVPSCGDDEPRVCLVVLAGGDITLAKYAEPKNSRPYWTVDGEVTHWMYVPELPDEAKQ
ncbi:hypothetical protein [Paraburkholderia unamae]|uniref:DUF551 domain-containing protein n=1 Tax=Paraburkholderia unamae TaxID=219649 RepID=A0ABX5KFZ3_9BURK|nr:hypothetical protein [Paraburkholderia unamae]PVX77187.1 hypothetical protein C7402_115246 [Paraburkholderia unamae]